MVNWVKLGTYAAYASIFVSVLSIAFHIYVFLIYNGTLSVNESNAMLTEVKRYAASTSVKDIFDWIAIDCIRIFTSSLLILGLKKKKCDTIYFWIEFKLAVLVVFASIIIWKCMQGHTYALDLAFPILTMVMNSTLAFLAIMAWRTI